MEHSRKIGKGCRIKIVNTHKNCEMGALILGKLLNFLAINKYEQCNINPDIFIVNSCCALTESREKVKRVINSLRARSTKPIVLFGCFADIDVNFHQEIIKLSSKDIEMADNCFEHEISISKINFSSLKKDLFVEYQKYNKPNLRRILISQGCKNNCSYCNIKKAKRHTKSRQIKEIVNEIADSSKKNEEIFLMADDCGSYGTDIGTNIIQLIRSILNVKKDVKVSIYSLFPQTLVEHENDFMDLIKTNRINYISVPVQSGSNRILKLMNRNYKIEKLYRVIEKIKKIKPNIWLYTHIIINFPTETISDLNKSIKIAKIFDDVLFLDYADNEMTQAHNIKPKLDLNTKESRVKCVDRHIRLTKKGLLIK